MTDDGGFEEQLAEYRGGLVHNGSVHWREERENYVLRWREYGEKGAVTQRSRTLADAEEAERTRELLQRWRSASPRALGKDQQECLRSVHGRIDEMNLSRSQRRELRRRARDLIRAGRSEKVDELLDEARRTPPRRRGNLCRLGCGRTVVG